MNGANFGRDLFTFLCNRTSLLIMINYNWVNNTETNIKVTYFECVL